MAAKSEVREFTAGMVIIREHEPGDSAFIVLSGEVEVCKHIEGQRVALGRMGPGSIFGEMSLLDDRPRSATVVALGPTRVSVIDRSRFASILAAVPREVRPLFSALSDRLRTTSALVSGLSQKERLVYSVCSLLSLLLAGDGAAAEGAPRRELLAEVVRVLAFSQERIEEVLRELAGIGLVRPEPGPDGERLVLPDPAAFRAFLDFLAERLGNLPGFPVPTRKYLVLGDRAQELLFFLKNRSGSLPRDREGRHHFDFDRYVRESVQALGLGVKEAILELQRLSGAGLIRLVKLSELAGGKAIVYSLEEINRAQLVLLQAREFDNYWRRLVGGRE